MEQYPMKYFKAVKMNERKLKLKKQKQAKTLAKKYAKSDSILQIIEKHTEQQNILFGNKRVQ